MTLETIEQIVTLISENPVSEITLELDGQRVHVRKSPSAYSPAPTMAADVSHAEVPSETPAAPPPAAPEEREPILLTAPMVGLFHHLSQPVRYGVLITPGDIVGSIESMKLMTDVPAQQGGRVVEVLAEDGGPVEYGQALFRLDAS